MARDLKEIIEEIKTRSDIVELIGALVPLRKKGKDYWAVCPFHADSDPSFSVVPVKQIFFCFGCRASGDAVTFWMMFHKLKFIDAVRALAARYSVSMAGAGYAATRKRYPAMKEDLGWQPAQYEKPSIKWQETAIKFIYRAFEALNDVPEAVTYLEGRGITWKSIVAYGLGYCKKREGGDLYMPREKWGLVTELNEKGNKKVLWLPEGWVIPCLGADGSVLKIRIRRKDLRFNKDMRYYFVPGGSNCTTMLNPTAKAHVVVESDLDGILIVQEAGDMVGAVVLGSVQTRPDQEAMKILRESCHVMMALDFDKAGAMAWPWWQSHIYDCIRWPVPEGKDPGEAWQKGVNIKEWIRAGLPEGLRR